MFNCFTSFIPNFRLTYSCENQFADGTRSVHGMSYKAGVCPLTVITVAYYHKSHTKKSSNATQKWPYNRNIYNINYKILKRPRPTLIKCINKFYLCKTQSMGSNRFIQVLLTHFNKIILINLPDLSEL